MKKLIALIAITFATTTQAQAPKPLELGLGEPGQKVIIEYQGYTVLMHLRDLKHFLKDNDIKNDIRCDVNER